MHGCRVWVVIAFQHKYITPYITPSCEFHNIVGVNGDHKQQRGPASAIKRHSQV